VGQGLADAVGCHRSCASSDPDDHRNPEDQAQRLNTHATCGSRAPSGAKPAWLPVGGGSQALKERRYVHTLDVATGRMTEDPSDHRRFTPDGRPFRAPERATVTARQSSAPALLTEEYLCPNERASNAGHITSGAVKLRQGPRAVATPKYSIGYPPPLNSGGGSRIQILRQRTCDARPAGQLTLANRDVLGGDMWRSPATRPMPSRRSEVDLLTPRVNIDSRVNCR
jgi:hypothetical protein